MKSHVAVLLTLLASLCAQAAPTRVERAVDALTQEHGPAQAERIRGGVQRVSERWWDIDGDDDAFVAFCREHFLTDPAAVEAAFARLQTVTEQIDGHLHEVRRELDRPAELDTGTISGIDRLLAGVDLAAHVDENLYGSKAAFLALLNFPIHDLGTRLAEGERWSREQWARSRMMDRFASRVPADVSREITLAFSRADRYIASYNVRMDRLVDDGGHRLFPEGLRLISHWGLRDELKSQYAEPDGLERQRTILRVMERIVRQEIPAEVIDNPDLVWNPRSNLVGDVGTDRADRKAARERDVRYETLLATFRAVRRADPYSPTMPSFIDRRFEQGREIPEREVEALLVSVLESKELRDLAGLVARRLGRDLEPFDIWYDGFKARGAIGEGELDRIVAARFPDVAAFQADLPFILRNLGFSPEKAAWLSKKIAVDPSRGAGHAMGAVRREDRAHLRTRFGPDGMDYKGYNIAIHELGHNVEQVFSLNGIDYWWLNGVPNTAFTEALAFVFQHRDLELLGLGGGDPHAPHLAALDTLWGTAEIGGVALVDMRVWRYMYEHPDADPAALREATLAIAREVWNRYYAPVFGVRDSEILAIYSHMIAFGLYLPDYPLGHIIAFQVANAFEEGDFGAEFERVCRQGRLTPDLWMRGAVGAPLSASALLAAAREAMDVLP